MLDGVEYMFLPADMAPFDAKITPRSGKHAALIRKSYQSLNL